MPVLIFMNVVILLNYLQKIRHQIPVFGQVPELLLLPEQIPVLYLMMLFPV